MLSRRGCSNTQPSNYAKLTLTHFLGTYYFIFCSIYTTTMHYVLHVHLWTNIWNPRIVICSYWIENWIYRRTLLVDTNLAGIYQGESLEHPFSYSSDNLQYNYYVNILKFWTLSSVSSISIIALTSLCDNIYRYENLRRKRCASAKRKHSLLTFPYKGYVTLNGIID